MKYLWSPWRMKYVLQHSPAANCIFCSALQQEDGPENLVLHRGNLAFVMMNRYPYTGGHLMVIPFVHQPSFENLEAAINTESMQLIASSMQVIRRIYNPDGFNIGANIGSAAGAGVVEHVHFHIVPRWAGDTNFMTSVGDTRVMPEDLTDSYQRLLAGWI
jgi:ATP adenylyltransferase